MLRESTAELRSPKLWAMGEVRRAPPAAPAQPCTAVSAAGPLINGNKWMLCSEWIGVDLWRGIKRTK